jgi:lincosamide nucleotidyltransferase A/C/D/E
VLFREFHGGDLGVFINSMKHIELPFWLEGGWGVDALVGHQTRWHSDLDIIIAASDTSRLVTYLATADFQPAARPHTTPWSFSLDDGKRWVVDVHAVEFDEAGNGSCGPNRVYPAEALRGRVRYEGNRYQPVQCVTAKWQVRFHTGYVLDEDDGKDMLALRKRFRVKLPPEYEQFADT